MMKKLFLFLLLAASISAQAAPRPISEIQGEKQISTFNGKTVTARGIVTARVRNGFYIQTPDGEDDKNSKTSEAIFVFTGKEPKSEATIGNLVEVTGMVDEYRPKAEPVTLPITQIRASKATDEISVVSKNNELPKPFVLTAVDLDPRSAVDALERYEGMRIKITSMTVTAPTGGRVDEKTGTSVSDGVFTGVLTGTPRPYREPGMEIFESTVLKPAPTVPIFDNNPEILRVDSDSQLGASAIEVSAGAIVKNIVGVLDYQYRTWMVLPDPTSAPSVSNNSVATAVMSPKEGEFTISSANLERFFDDTDEPSTDEPILTREAFQNRLKKASIFIRDYLKTPDVLAVIEMENLATLKKLAEKINSDAAAAGKTDVKYEGFIEDGNDIGGIDSGFLVNIARVQVMETKQFGKEEMFKRPSDSKSIPLNDRPPFLLRASIKKRDKTFTFTVVANHLKSLRGYFDKDGNTRAKKKLQAEYLARWIQSRQTANPNEPLILVGDFNAFQFNDGVVDVIGTLKGKPAPKEQVMMPTEDLVNPDLINLVDFIPREQRYSYVFAGNAQVLDHFLVNEVAKKHAVRFGYSRANADFPESYRNDPNRPERISDHDAPIGYFSIDEVPQAATPNAANQPAPK